MSRAIGGFLPLRFPQKTVIAKSVLEQWVGDCRSVWMLHNARSALHALWSGLMPRRVWLPAYACREIAQAIPSTIETVYYPVSQQLFPQVDFLADNLAACDHVLAIDYFGRGATPEFVDLIRDRPTVGWIQDAAHSLDALFAGWGDWILYSPRKLFGVPDGGVLVGRTKELWPIDLVATSDFSFVLPSIERLNDCDEVANARWYASYTREERGMKVGLEPMSFLSTSILSGLDGNEDRAARSRNYDVLHSRLGEWALFPETKVPFVPMGFPMRSNAAAAVCEKLALQRIFVARHWKDLPSDPAHFPGEHRLASELMTLPCDYRYDETQMHCIADAVFDAMAF